MSIEYARAYSNERLAHAEAKRYRRHAALAGRAFGQATRQPIRMAIGGLLISIGEQLSRSAVSGVKGNA